MVCMCVFWFGYWRTGWSRWIWDVKERRAKIPMDDVSVFAQLVYPRFVT